MSDVSSSSNYQRIVGLLHHVRTEEENTRLRRGVLLSAAAILALSLLSLALEAVAQFDITGRTALVAAAALGIALSVAALAGPALLTKFVASRKTGDDAMALAVGRHFPGIKDRLLNVLQLHRETNAHGAPAYSAALVDASFGAVARDVLQLDLSPVVDHSPAQRAQRIALATLAVTALACALLPSTLFNAGTRLLHFRTDFAPSAPFEFLVTPGTVEAVKGEDVVLSARTSLRTQPDIVFHVREAEQSDFDLVAATRDSAGAATHTIAAIRNSMVYYAEAKGYRSAQFTVTVVDRPAIRSMRIALAFPAYTKLPPRYLEDNTGDITALAGTTARFELVLNKDIADARIVFSDSQSVPLALHGASADASVRLMQDRAYHFALTDAAGIANAHPITYTMTIVPDLPPTVQIIDPEPQANLDESMRLPVLSRIGDDFGFSKLILHYRLAASKFEEPSESFTSIVLPLPSAQKTELDVPYVWNLSSLGLAPEDVVNYFLEVFDNDNVRGPKSSRSQIYSVRLPSIEEVFAKADKTQEKAVEDLQKALSGADDVQKQIEKLQREMKQQNTEKLDWQQKRTLEETLKRQEKILDDVKRVKEQMSKLDQDMQKQNMLSEETMKKYQELQELMEQIDAPQLREAMKRLNESMKQMTPEQMKQAMEQFKFSEESFQRSIDRTIELLKRLQIEQKTDELTRRAEDLAKKQEDLANRTENTSPSDKNALDKLAKEQDALKKQAEAMQREMKELQQKMEEFPQDMPLDEMKDAQAELNLAQMQQDMNEASGECSGGNCKSASQNQKKIGDKLKKFQKKMEKVKKKLNENQERMIQQAFKRALDNVLGLSKKQEQLRNETASLPPNSQVFREQLQEQAELMQELNTAANELLELGKKSFSVTPEMAMRMGSAMQKMRQSLDKMQSRDSKSSGEQQGGAMSELNEAAKEIAKGMQSSKSGGSSQGGSLMQQLQKLAQQQMGINQGTQSAGQGQMTQQQMAQMQRLAQQQAALQKGLQDLNEEAKKSAEGKRLLGDLTRIAEDMQEVVRDMQQGEVNPNTMQKQERILSRLLDASRSMRERDWEKKRRGETGRDVARRSPSALDPSALDPASGLKFDMQKAVEEGYSRDYEQLIRQYFQALEKIIAVEK
ncbi:MAG: hypothetical protein IPP94_05800 [Ignavibacteria bacterium]|nr:hypothetical protein [Ignavibacteria bacterium]